MNYPDISACFSWSINPPDAIQQEHQPCLISTPHLIREFTNYLQPAQNVTENKAENYSNKASQHGPIIPGEWLIQSLMVLIKTQHLLCNSLVLFIVLHNLMLSDSRTLLTQQPTHNGPFQSLLLNYNVHSVQSLFSPVRASHLHDALT